MDLIDCKKCDKCNTPFGTAPFVNMCGNGELAYSKITLYGNRYDLCPKCTAEIYDFINKHKLLISEVK